MIQAAFDREGKGRTVMHEWASMDIYAHFCDFKENGNESSLEKIRDLFRSCPYDCVVGNGYAMTLPLIAEIFGERVTLVHLKRHDRDACVASLVRNAELFPVNHRYYAASREAVGRRMAAFHFGEATREEWDRWPIDKKFYWYYDKTHQLIENHKNLFTKQFFVQTERLSDENTRQIIGQAAGVAGTPSPIFVNKHFDLDALSSDQRAWVQRFLGKLDIARLASEDHYGVKHSLYEYLHKMTYQIESGQGIANPQKAVELQKDLERARAITETGLAQIKALIERLDLKRPWIKKIGSKLKTILSSFFQRQKQPELNRLRSQNQELSKELHLTRRRNFIPRSKISAAGPSIFLVTIPKSATSYISQSLAKSLGYDHCSTICSPAFPDNFLFPSMMYDFQRGGMVAVSHMRPTDWNLRVFKFFGGKKIVIHVRDPRATMVSWLHFVDKVMREAVEKNDRERQAITRLTAAYPDPSDYFSLTQDQKIKALTESFYQHCIDRIISWLEVKDPEIERLFLTYEDFLKDQDGYFKRLTEFYGIDTKIAGPPKTTNPHFRQGTKDGWRKELNEEQIRKLNERMPDLLWKRFGWERD